MSEFGQKLSDDVRKTFEQLVKSDRKLGSIRKRIRDGTDYTIANEYAIRTGELMSGALRANTRTLEYMSEEVAREVIIPALTTDYEMVSAAAVQIQRNMNTANGLGLNALAAPIDNDRIEGFVNKIASYESFSDARWMIGEPVVNYSQSVVDFTIERNARAHSKLGMEPTIERILDPSETAKGNGPCAWCQGLAGVYKYSEVKNRGNEIFLRHRGCRCQVIYKEGERRQDVWSKSEWTGDDAAASREAILQKQREREARQAEASRQRQLRLSGVEEIQRELGYSPKGSAIAYNIYKRDFASRGLSLDYFIEVERQTNPFARRRRTAS